MEHNQLILSAKDVNIQFNLRGKVLHAIRGIDLDLYQGEVLAIVGESGSGKSVFTKSFMGLLDANGVAWQIGELGRLDLGGGGTIAKYVANRGIPVLDIGVPVLSMHSPFEVIHKTDLYMAYRTFSLFCQNAE